MELVTRLMNQSLIFPCSVNVWVGIALLRKKIRIQPQRTMDCCATNTQIDGPYLLTENMSGSEIVCEQFFLERSRFLNLLGCDKNRNKTIFHDRVIVENFFRCLCTFGMFSRKWKWDKKGTRCIFKLKFPSLTRVFYSTLFVLLIGLFCFRS